MKKVSFFIALLCFFVSCRKTETPQGGEPYVPYQPTYEVGDYFKNDTLEGVVFYTYGAHNGLMVSLEEAELPWCDSAHVVCRHIEVQHGDAFLVGLILGNADSGRIRYQTFYDRK